MPDTSLRAVFAGRRGRLLVGLLLAEFAAAVQLIALSTVLPLAARELSGAGLYGATLAAGSLTMVLVLGAGAGLTARWAPRTTLLVATALYVVGVLVAATAPTMGLVLAGSVLRGTGGGLMAAFGLTAVGGLFDDAVRPRVLGLFALVWLLPSLAGPVLNAAVAVWAGWRVAMAWPVAVVVVSRLLLGRDAALLPRATDRRPPALGPALAAAGGLVLASAATTRGAPGVGLLAGGLLVAVLGSARVVARAADGDRRRTRVVAVFAGLVTAFLAGDGLVPLAVVEGLGRGVVATAVGVGAGLVGWSVAGARPPRRGPDPARTGPALVTLALGAEVVALTAALPGSVALVLVVVGWGVGGVGIGLAYGPLSSRAMDALEPGAVAAVATAVAFAETVASVAGSLLGAGVYSLGAGLSAVPRASITAGFALAAVVGLATTVLAARLPGRVPPPARRRDRPPARDQGP